MLTQKQRDFIASYVECWHVTKAAIAAGYSERSAYSIGSENLKKPEIAAAIAEHITTIMPPGEVLTRLAEQARGSSDDFLTIERVKRRDTIAQKVINDDGEEETRFVPGPEYEVVETRLDFEKVKARGKLHLIKKISETKYGLQIEVYDAQNALIQIGKHHKLFTDKVEHSGSINVSELSDDELRRLAEGTGPS